MCTDVNAKVVAGPQSESSLIAQAGITSLSRRTKLLALFWAVASSVEPSAQSLGARTVTAPAKPQSFQLQETPGTLDGGTPGAVFFKKKEKIYDVTVLGDCGPNPGPGPVGIQGFKAKGMKPFVTIWDPGCTPPLPAPAGMVSKHIQIGESTAKPLPFILYDLEPQYIPGPPLISTVK